MQNCQRGTLDKAEGSCHYYKAAGHEVISFFAGMGHLLPMPPAQSPRWAPPRGPHDLSLPQPGLLESSGGEAEAHMGTLTRPTSLCLLWPAQQGRSSPSTEPLMCLHFLSYPLRLTCYVFICSHSSFFSDKFYFILFFYLCWVFVASQAFL